MTSIKPRTEKASMDTASSIYTLVNEETTLYHDRFVELTTVRLIIRSCYFPGISFKIPLDTIESVDGARDIGVPVWQRKELGMGPNPTIWWALDFRRNALGLFKQFYPVIVKVRGKCQRKGFSVEDPKRFMSLIRQAINQVDMTHRD
jgi:hypothetical protein